MKWILVDFGRKTLGIGIEAYGKVGSRTGRIPVLARKMVEW